MESVIENRYINPSDVITKGEEELSDLLKCMICMNILNKPVECKNCQRAMCQKCLDNLINKKCPLCAKNNFSKPHLQTTHNLEKLKFKCKRNCNKIISYSEYFSHGEKCENKKIKCQNIGCGMQMKRKEFLNHSKSCQFRIMVCSYCDNQLKLAQFVMHEQNCPMKKDVMLLITSSPISNTKVVSSIYKDDYAYNQVECNSGGNTQNQYSAEKRTEMCSNCGHEYALLEKDIHFNNCVFVEEGVSIKIKCKKCERNKFRVENRCNNCMKLFCDDCNPYIYEDFPFWSPFFGICKKLGNFSKNYYDRPAFFFPLYKICNFSETREKSLFKCIIFYTLLGWIDLFLTFINIIILSLLILFSAIFIFISFLIYIFFYLYMYLFRRKKLCKIPCEKFSYKDLLKRYLGNVCKHSQIIGSYDGESWASTKNFNINYTFEEDGKIQNEFKTVINLFNIQRFIKNTEISINKEKHILMDFIDDVLHLERVGGGTAITKTNTKLLVAYYTYSERIKNTGNYQNFNDAKYYLLQLKLYLEGRNL
jgi:hypothetical protein